MATYTVNTIPALTITTPTAGAAYVPETDDAIREIKRCLQYSQAVHTITANYTATYDKSIILGNNTSNITVTLPTAASIAGRGYTIIKITDNAYTVTVDGDGSETIDGAATKVLRGQYDILKIYSDGTNWVSASTNIFNYTVSAKTANYTITAAECAGLTIFTNDGASAEITLTLPTAVAGYRVTIIVSDAYNLIVAPGASDTIRIGGSQATTDIRSSTVGDTVELIAINAVEWMALNPSATTFTVN